jgi:hypothetical protein
MKLITSAAVIVAALGLGAMAPAAFAQDQAAPQAGPSEDQRPRLHFRDGDHPGMPRGMRGGPLQLVCAEEGAERLEHMFIAISYRLGLTAEQTPLFDALKTAALTAQTSFADTCASLRPAAGETAGMSSLVERLQTRIAVDEARIAALSGLLPSLEVFYGSLTDEQKAKLDVGPGEMRREHFGKRQGGPDRGDGPNKRWQMLDHNG